MILLRTFRKKDGEMLAKAFREARAKLKAEETFEIICDSESSSTRKLSVGDYFLDKMKGWAQFKSLDPKSQESFPGQYSDLEGLPCILILCERGRMGDDTSTHGEREWSVCECTARSVGRGVRSGARTGGSNKC